jgi:hypothetical protein
MSLKTIKSFNSVVSKCGGPKALSLKLGFGDEQTGQAIHIWRKEKKFPPKHYFKIQFLMLDQGYIAASSLFSFDERGVPKKFKSFKRIWFTILADELSKRWRPEKRKKEVLRVAADSATHIEAR